MTQADWTVLSLHLAALLAAAIALGAVARRLGIPAVVGEIAGGLLLGPTLLGRLAPEFSAWLFPPAGPVASARGAIARVGMLFFIVTIGLDAVETRAADAAIAAITITVEREEHIDFAHPYFKSGLRVAIPARLGPTWFSTLRRFLSADMLGMFGALVGLTFLTANVLWFVERHVNSESFPRSYLAGVGESVWWSVATIITGGCENKAPVSLPGRMVAVAWMLGSIVLVASFTATMSSQMTAESVAGVISGPEGLPGRSVATVHGTAAVADLRAMNAHVVECASPNDAIQAVATGRADAVVFDAPVLAYLINSDDRCAVRLVGPTFETQDYGIALPSGSPLRKRVNIALLELAEAGKLVDLNRKWFGTAD